MKNIINNQISKLFDRLVVGNCEWCDFYCRIYTEENSLGNEEVTSYCGRRFTISPNVRCPNWIMNKTIFTSFNKVKV